MSLADLIRKRGTSNPANANPAKAANDGQVEGGTLARLAALALANLTEAKTATSWGWLLHYTDADPMMVYTSPESSLSEVLRDFPGAIAAEPIKATPRPPTGPMTADQEAAIRAWLARIEETDPYIIADVLEQCRGDADARDYFIGQTANSREGQ